MSVTRKCSLFSQRNYVLKHLEDLCILKKQNKNESRITPTTDEAAVPDVADDAASASSPVLFPLALETVDQSCVTGEEDITEGPPQSLGISAKVSFLGTCVIHTG